LEVIFCFLYRSFFSDDMLIDDLVLGQKEDSYESPVKRESFGLSFKFSCFCSSA